MVARLTAPSERSPYSSFVTLVQRATRSIQEVVELYVDAYETGDTSRLDEIISPSFVDHSFPAFSGGPEGVRRSITVLHQGFGNIEYAVEDCICAGDTAAIRVVTSATHIGTFSGKPATGKRVTWSACDFIRVRDGQITELWSVQDTIALLGGIGVLPAP